MAALRTGMMYRIEKVQSIRFSCKFSILPKKKSIKLSFEADEIVAVSKL